MTSPARAPRQPPRRAPDRATRPRPDLRVVRVPAHRWRSGAVVAVCMVVVFGALLASAIAHSLLVGGQAQLDRVDQEIRAERDLLQQDQLRLAGYQSPQRIALVATELGMVPADDATWLRPNGDSPPVATGTPDDDEHGERGGPDRPIESDGPDGPDGFEAPDASELAIGSSGTAAGPG
ncbi:hypothetical protein BH23ACT2_BH23ACT2_08310 [soil metagenome]